MAFANLTTTTQNLLLVEYSFFFKATVFFGAVVFALFYLFYWKNEKEKPTVFYTVGILRLIISLLSWITLIMSPLILLLLSPDYELSLAVGWLIPTYLAFVTIGLITMVIDVFYYLPTVLLKYSGFDMHDPKINKVYSKVKKYFKKNG